MGSRNPRGLRSGSVGNRNNFVFALHRNCKRTGTGFDERDELINEGQVLENFGEFHGDLGVDFLQMRAQSL